jgi:hypothetical protein
MNLKNIILGIGIIIVFGLLLWQGIETFHPSPQYEDYCGLRLDKRIPMINQETCEELGGRWNSHDYPLPETNITGYCDEDFTCRQQFEDAQKLHSQVAFYVSLIAGLIVLILGITILHMEPVGSALIGSGIWALFWGSAINWRNFTSGIRFTLLLVAFIFIIYVTLRLNGVVKWPRRKKKKSLLGFLKK